MNIYAYHGGFDFMSVKDTLKAAVQIVKRRSTMVVSGGSRFDGLHNEVKTLGLDNSGLSALVTGFIGLAIMVSVGIVILASVGEAMPAVNESSPFAALQTSTETGIVSGYGLIVIILLLVAAAGVMVAVRMLGGNK